MNNRGTYKHITNGNIVFKLADAVSEKTNTPIVVFVVINSDKDYTNKIRTVEDFNQNYKPYKVK